MKLLLVVLVACCWPVLALAAPPTAEQEFELRGVQLEGELYAVAAAEKPGPDADNERAHARAACQHLEDAMKAFDTDPVHRAGIASCWGAVKFWSGDKAGGCADWAQARALTLASSHRRAANQLTSLNTNLERCPAS